MKALITRKIGMTSLVSDDGIVTPVTLLSASPNVVTQLKSVELDGYLAMQIGTETAKKPSKALQGHVKAAKVAVPKIIREIRLTEVPQELSVGTELRADVFNVGDIVHVTGTSKGKGFAGTIKRHNFHRGRKTHGGNGDVRKVGSIGSMYPQRIFKGKRMAGRMGHAKTTVQNLKIALVDTELSVIAVSGAVPGPRRSIVMLKEAK